MIIVTKPTITDAELDQIRERIEHLGLRAHISRGEQRVIIGCIGDESLLRDVPLLSMPGVESVTPVLKPYKLASREFAASRRSPSVSKIASNTSCSASSASTTPRDFTLAVRARVPMWPAILQVPVSQSQSGGMGDRRVPYWRNKRASARRLSSRSQ